jgi:hypothetical protein
MNLSFLTETDWKEFKVIFPDADHFLLKRSLENELGHLQRFADAFGEETLSRSAQRRIKELRKLGVEPHEQKKEW